jgi:hypothetical protein
VSERSTPVVADDRLSRVPVQHALEYIVDAVVEDHDVVLGKSGEL